MSNLKTNKGSRSRVLRHVSREPRHTDGAPFEVVGASVGTLPPIELAFGTLLAVAAGAEGNGSHDASALVLRALRESLNATLEPEAELRMEVVAEALRLARREAVHALRESLVSSERAPEVPGVVVALIAASGLHVASSGDGCALLFRDGTIEVLADTGVEGGAYDLAGGDRIVICNQALIDSIDEERIASILDRHGDADAAVDRLLAEVLAEGPNREVRVVVGDIVEPPEPDAARH